MIGLELNINGKTIRATAIRKKSLSIILNKIGEKITLKFSGVDFECNQSLCWYESTLKLGDKFSIRVKDILQDSQPVEIKKVNTPPIWTPEQEKEQEKREIQQFLQLKKLLLEKGLLEDLK